MQFYKTVNSSFGKKHFHLLYVATSENPDPNDPQQGQVMEIGEAVGDEGAHRHEITLSPDGTIVINPSLVDGHTHEFYEEIRDSLPSRPEKEDIEVVSRVYEHYKFVYSGERDSFKRAIESDKFYKGDQWDGKKEELEADGRAALTINLTQKHIDDLCGYQRQQRSDTRFLPTKDMNQGVCELLNIVYKIIQQQNNFSFEEARSFEDAAIAGRGNYSFSISQKKDIRGDLIIGSYPWDQVIYGPHTKSDGSDCEVLLKTQMVSVDKLKAENPQLKKKIEESYAIFDTPINKAELTMDRQYLTDHYAQGNGIKIPYMVADKLVVNKARKEIMVVELEEKIYIPVVILYDSRLDQTVTTVGWQPATIKQALTIPNISALDQDIQKMRITRVAGSLLLSDDYVADVPDDDFTIIPIYCKRRGGDFWSKVELIKDVQREVNKRISQSIDVVNNAALYGFFYDQSTFPDSGKQFQKHGTRPGFKLEVTSTNNIPVKMEGIKVPAEMLTLVEAAENRLERMISVDATRFAGANTSANAILQAEKSALVGNEFLFKNLALANRKAALKFVSYLKKYYSPERLYDMISERNAAEPVQVNGQPFEDLDRESVLRLFSDHDLTKVDVAVEEATASTTERIAMFTIISDLMSKGAPIPFEALLPLLDLPKDYKQSVQNGILAQQQSQATAESAKQDSEVVKSLIGQGLFPPEVLKKYGLAQPNGALPPGPLPPGIELPGNNMLPTNVPVVGGGAI